MASILIPPRMTSRGLRSSNTLSLPFSSCSAWLVRSSCCGARGRCGYLLLEICMLWACHWKQWKGSRLNHQKTFSWLKIEMLFLSKLTKRFSVLQCLIHVLRKKYFWKRSWSFRSSFSKQKKKHKTNVILEWKFRKSARLFDPFWVTFWDLGYL